MENQNNEQNPAADQNQNANCQPGQNQYTQQPQNNNYQNNQQFRIPPKTWLVESILVTLFCCLPFGIIGIINASKVETLFYQGDVGGAERASMDAARWVKIGFWIGMSVIILTILFYVLIFVLAIFGVAAESSSLLE